MSFWKSLFERKSESDRAVESLGTFIKYAIKNEAVFNGEESLTVVARGCRVRGVPIGDWEVSVCRATVKHNG